MKILTLNSNLRQIGTYGRCFYFSRELARYGHDVTMITVSPDSKFGVRSYFVREYRSEYAEPSAMGPWVRMIEAPNLGYKWLPGWGSGPLDIAERIRRILTEDYDVVYGFEYQPNVSWPVYLTRLLKPYTFYSDWCDWHSGSANWLRGYKWAHRIDGFFEDHIRFLAQRVTVTSRVLFQRARSIGIPEDRIDWIPQGIDTDYCRPFPKQESRLRFGLSADRPIVLAVREGTMVHEVRVFSHVLKRMPEALLIVVGNVPNEARRLSKELAIEHSVHWTGWVSDEEYPQYIACADVCFLPKDRTYKNSHANWTGKFLDYLACGRPAVVNDIGEEGAMLRENEVGVLSGDSDDEFADTIVALLKDEERAACMGANARRLMVEKWDWRMHGERIAKVVEIG